MKTNGKRKIELTDEMIIRYSRQIILDEVGGEGQKKLLSASVFIAGTGGLGVPAAMYLVAAGVGRIAIADFDKVDLSNLQRQVLYYTEDVGKPKVEVAAEKLRKINPDVEVVPINEKISASNVMDLIKDYDIVLDGSDNFSARYVISDSCVILKKPYVYGSVLRFEGQVSTFISTEGPCYRCLYPSPPPPGMMPSCQEAGVLGVVPGIIGLIQANEVLKLILGKGNPLVGKLLVFDALNTEFSMYSVRKRRDCPVCGENPTITTPEDIEEWCSVNNLAM
ncbi:putative adenylyltransferase/sulfurtransferase MoeZ [bacterium HR19]|nr:putative adenylyltransferase/sulfurtransferase MoeZ [bacterium HR19]